ncbi:undecaprenyl-diphosphatase [Thioclava sp. ES.031]|uniref:bifunctional DedA family/phosphatase PAP2 family protein n=1 Tax=Thioclava sp. ES.031 TaxID=1798203 RepID=UPI000BF24CDD|nr:bifunctional DedA family/phosphatase PAP2 family protein [Thioclava sp. ES.031]PFG63313.1 undecaprenyl-diphosphatase [Thioclava sp. ES.031]
MPDALPDLLPSLAALGSAGYWVFAVAAALEAFLVTGLFLPGTLIVVLGGVLVQQGILDLTDLIWFAAIGSSLGGEASWWLGHHARRGRLGRWNVEGSESCLRAARLIDRRGGAALILGRFEGRLAGYVPFAAALGKLGPTRFRLWNIVSGFPYAIVFVGLGYVLGLALTKVSPLMTRTTLFLLGFLLTTAVVIWTLRRLDRAVPHLLEMAGGLMDEVARHPRVDSWGGRHPKTAAWIARRLDRSKFSGLPLSLLVVGFLYLASVLVGLSFDFLQSDPIVQIDARLAALMRLFWTPGLIQIFTWITALGDTQLVAALLVLALVWLAWLRRFDLAAGLAVSLGLDLISVIILKAGFGRPRSILGYFHETSGSFPSGHATLSVAFFGMLVFILWRLTRLGALSASFLALLFAGLIGLSRLYLVEHYLSDVLGGWLLGSMCLLVGVAVAEWLYPRWAGAPRARPLWQIGVIGVVTLALVGFTAMRVRDYSKALNPPPVAQPLIVISEGSEPQALRDAPLRVQTLDADRQFPLSIALWASNSDQIATALGSIGWQRADAATLKTLAGAAFGAARDTMRPGAALAPLFWRNEPSELGFTRPSDGSATLKLPRLRMWQTRYTDASGARLWMGAITRDDGLEPSDGSGARGLVSDLVGALAKGGVAEPVGQISGRSASDIPVLALR